MTNAVAVWAVVLLALLLANLPFLSSRLFSVIPVRTAKTLAVRLMELVVSYFFTGGVALALEHRMGQIAPQGWEFYAVTSTLFLTFAFPGFVYCYLLKR